MGHNRLKWNISIDKGIEIAHSIIKDILSENKNPVPIDELIFLVNNRAKKYKIHNNRKHNCFTKYLTINHGGIINFLDSYTSYGIINKEILSDYDELHSKFPFIKGSNSEFIEC